LLLLAPAVGAAFWLLGTRRMLARYAAVEDLPDPAEIVLRDRAQALAELLLDRRDALLAAALDEVLARYGDKPLDIGVVYGAGHMPGLTRYLVAKYGFRPREAEWLTVFDF
jgi:pheromone shutdown protein TraB